MLVAAFAQYFFGISIFVSSIFLILLVLVQRGRGGGLTGALGGAGGQSAFGTKAGDLFTRITVGVAVVWIVLCAASVFFLKSRGLPELSGSGANINVTAPDSIGTGNESSSSDMTGGLGAGGTQGPAVDPGVNLSPLNSDEQSDAEESTGVEAELNNFDDVDGANQSEPSPSPATESEGTDGATGEDSTDNEQEPAAAGDNG